MYQNVHCSTIYSSQDMEQPKCPSTDEWIKKMWHIYTMEYYSAIKRNKIELFVVRWMDLESVIPSEVSQKGKNKYRTLTQIYGIIIKKRFLSTYGQGGNNDTDVESGLKDMGRGKGKLGRSERVALTYIHYQM